MVSEGNELGDLEELQSFMEALSEKLEKTPYDYSTYTRWIELLRPVGDIGSLRVARESMLSNIAAPIELWTQWIEEEKAQPDALCSPESLAIIRDLYERATTEYMSVSIWQQYIEFAKDLESSDNAAATRSAAIEAFGSENYIFSILQDAVEAISHHFSEGQIMWIEYKEYIEQMLLETSDNDQRESLLELLKSVYLQRLGQPHAQLESTFSMYSGFVTKFINQDYEQQMVEANKIVSGTRKACSKREDYEAELVKSESSWNTFRLYIDRLAKDKVTETKEINTLYERCLAIHCYSPEIWDEYLSFAVQPSAADDISAQNADVAGLLHVIASRAVRNCPWSGKIWAQLSYATFMQQGYEAANAVYEQAMNTHAVDYSMAEYAQLAIARVNIARLAFQRSEIEIEPEANGDAEVSPIMELQQLSQICRTCLSTAYTMPMETADPHLALERCCTTVVARIAKDTPCAREMWTSICKSRKICAEAWVLSAEFEREYGSMENARNVYRHAAQRKLDNPDRIFDAWIVFENSFGDILTLRAAERFINAQRYLQWRRLEKESNANFASTSAHQEAMPSFTASDPTIAVATSTEENN
ncbi:Splicing factor, partial [Coemansia asiatica]